MKILLLSRGYAPKKEPLWGCFELQQAEALQRAGNDVIVACVDDRLIAEDRFLRSIQLPGFKKHSKNNLKIYSIFFMARYVAIRFGFAFYKKLYDWQYCKLYDKIVARHGVPDVIYSHFLRTNYFAANLHEKYGVPVVGVEHWSELNKPIISSYVKKLGELTYPRLNRLICVSSVLSNRIKEVFGVNSDVINNIVDINFDNKGRFKRDDNKIKMVTVARLTPQKKINHILDALYKANLPNNIWELKIIGNGPLERILKQQTKELGLSHNVHYLGIKPHDEVCRILSESDFFVLASDYETFGVVFIEAMSFGLPVIGTRCGGPETIINDDNGILVENGDIDGLSEAIKTMMKTYKNYSAESIIKEVKDKYSPSAIVLQIEKVLKKAIEENKK
jgi:glycosyltransferase involved in cell wall biosynthesis